MAKTKALQSRIANILRFVKPGLVPLGRSRPLKRRSPPVGRRGRMLRFLQIDIPHMAAGPSPPNSAEFGYLSSILQERRGLAWEGPAYGDGGVALRAQTPARVCWALVFRCLFRPNAGRKMNSEPRDMAGPPAIDTLKASSSLAGGKPLARETLTLWLAIVLAVVIFGGGLFGYDQGVISGALAGIKATFSLSLFMVQVVTSYVTLGALAGSLASGALGDWLGRKRTILLAALLFTLGAAVQWMAPGAIVLVAGRLIVGIGVGDHGRYFSGLPRQRPPGRCSDRGQRGMAPDARSGGGSRNSLASHRACCARIPSLAHDEGASWIC